MNGRFTPWFWLLAISFWLLTTGASPPSDDETAVDPKSLPSYFPPAATVTLQLLSADESDASGNVLVTATLDEAGLAALISATGQQTFASVHMNDSSTVLRDDGTNHDAVAGDGRFSFVSDFDLETIHRRAAMEMEADAAGALTGVPSFRGRQLIGVADRAPFDLEGFLAGRAVPIQPFIASRTSPSGTDDEFREVAYFGLFISNSQELYNPGAGGGFDMGHLALADPERTWDPCTQQGSPDGVWTFNHLMTQMAGSHDPAEFVEQWMTLFTQDQQSAATNWFTVPAIGPRAVDFLDAWPTTATGALDLARSPFRLLAIVPRVDLRTGSTTYGGELNAGELRFIFGAVDYTMSCAPVDFSVILEFGVPIGDCAGVRHWASQWLTLDDVFWGGSDEDYLAALEALTVQVTIQGAAPGKPNGSALNQLRSNEIFLNTEVWRIREFHLEPSGFLEQATTAQTPDVDFKENRPDHFDFLIQLPWLDPVPLILALPGQSGERFLGAEALVRVPEHTEVAWGKAGNLDFANDPALNDERHRRSLATCDGCHAAEIEPGANPALGMNAHMVDPENGRVSPFIAGGGDFEPSVPFVVEDAVVPGTTRSFYDLLRRYNDLRILAESLCPNDPPIAVDLLSLDPVSQVH